MSYKSLHFPNLKRRPKYSAYRHYRDFRQEIRVDCQGRCVYCDAHENEIGGEAFMTLDHFRPKDKYSTIKHDPTNLLWSCQVCNNLKDNWWPAYGTPHTVVGNTGFIDPFKENRGDYFDVLPDGELSPLKPPAQWIIGLLRLNRTGAKKIRESRNQKYEIKQRLEKFYTSAINDAKEALENPQLPEKEKERWRTHKEKLEQQYRLLIKDNEMDFRLY